MPILSNKHILIIIENLPAPFDRRVWQEATTLEENGAKVSIICPKMRGYNRSYEQINNINIYRYPLPLEGDNSWSYFIEYTAALFWQTFLSIKIFLKDKFQVIHACNPPDTIFLVALPFKLFGTKFVFDHHDINPELYLAKFGRKDIFYQLMIFLEKMTFKVADFSIATNESYKKIAIDRGKMIPARVAVIRSGPSLERVKVTSGDLKYKKGKKHLVGYVGVIGDQEGLDLLMQVAKLIKDVRNDVQFAIIGSGTSLNKIKHLAKVLEVDSLVDFYGRVDDDLLFNILNTCDVCVNPDKPTEMNNLSTMNKIMEYMALKKPIVQFDLKEGRASAKESSLYAENHNIQDFANKVIYLLDHPEKAKEMGILGYQRVINKLSWTHEKEKLTKFYCDIFSSN
jgi:glycosyltransferase involved in cell wall biosynthesis